jgi:hypothetical protein
MTEYHIYTIRSPLHPGQVAEVAPADFSVQEEHNEGIKGLLLSGDKTFLKAYNCHLRVPFRTQRTAARICLLHLRITTGSSSS